MNSLTIVDTDILIDVGRGDESAVEFLKILDEDSKVAVNVITQMDS